jgi:hypothetical protein
MYSNNKKYAVKLKRLGNEHNMSLFGQIIYLLIRQGKIY